MATSSYQVLARYNDCSVADRVRCTEDIRRRQRQALVQERSLKKNVLRYQNRRSLKFSKSYLNEDDESDYLDVLDSSNISTYSDECVPETWDFGWGHSSPPRSDAPSPAPSQISEPCSDGYLASSPVPQNKFFSRNIHRTPESHAHSFLKSRNLMLRTRKAINNDLYDHDQIKFDYDILKVNILQCREHLLVDNLVCSSWETLGNAIKDSHNQLSLDCTHFIAQLAEIGAIKIETLLHILQQGLIFNIATSMLASVERHDSCVELILTIIKKEPRSIAFIIETMANTHMFRVVNEAISQGTEPESLASLNLYNNFLGALLNQIIYGNRHTPLVPRIVLSTCSQTTILQAYSPEMSLKRLLATDFHSSIISRYLSQPHLCDANNLPIAIQLLSYCLLSNRIVNNSSERHLLMQFRSQSLETRIFKIVDSNSLRDNRIRMQLKEFLTNYQEFLKYAFASESC